VPSISDLDRIGRASASPAGVRAGPVPAHHLRLGVVLVLPEIYRTFVVERGWSNDRYEAWLADCLGHQLLGGSAN
jgi:hypothetical protein